MQTSVVVECPKCKHQDDLEGFGKRPMVAYRRVDHEQILVCVRCGYEFARKSLSYPGGPPGIAPYVT